MSTNKFIQLLILFLLATITGTYAQTTIGGNKDPKLSNEEARAGSKHKVLVIPFEPRMYMSQIDHRINQETHWDQKKIKAEFRKGLDDELYKSIRKKMNVITLLDDTVKYKKDLEDTYEKLAYEYDKVPSQEKFQAPKKEKDNKYIQKGQLIADSDNEGRFMNAVIKDKTLLSKFNTKFKADIFLFINELDITSMPDPNGFGTNSLRTLTVHYTVFSANGAQLNSGVSRVNFPNDVNSPSKISGKYLSKISDEITQRIEKSIAPVK